MVAPSPADDIRALAEPHARAAGLVVESVTVTPAGRRRVLRVIVDLPEDRTGGVPMDAVAEAAQSISTALDDSPVMGGAPYVLEVSSPGTDRPLTERRHWLRARGRLVRLLAPAGRPEPAPGRLTAVGDTGIVLDGDREIGWSEIASGRIEVEFGRPDEATGEAPEEALDEDFGDVDDTVDGLDDDLDDGDTDDVDSTSANQKGEG